MPASIILYLRQIYYGVGYTAHRDGESTVAFTAASVQDAIKSAKEQWFGEEDVACQIKDLGYGMLSLSLQCKPKGTPEQATC